MHQVIHLETFSNSIFVIAAIFRAEGEIPGNSRDPYYFDKIKINLLTLKNIHNSNKMIYDAEILPGTQDFQKIINIRIKDNIEEKTEHVYDPLNEGRELILSKCNSNFSYDVKIQDNELTEISEEEKKKIGPKICQFRIA